MASRYPFVGAAAHLFSEKRNKNAVFLHIRERQHSSLFVQIFAVAGNHIFIPSKGLFPVPCRRPVRVPTDQEKLTCNSHQFQESRRFVILIANLFFTSAAFFAPVILSRIRYPTAPVCKNVQSQNCELLTTLENITNLQYRMISDYTERVQRLQKGSCTSKLMIDVVNYIWHHISELITVEKMAEALFMSRPYLSRKFKEETGESLTDFILYEKTEETKRLLRYSDKPITAISSYLGFSSPSHFSRVFKARVCITPGEYREKHP